MQGTFSSVTTINNSTLNLIPVLTYKGTELDISFAGPATHFAVTRTPRAVTAGTALAVTVTALDQFNNTAISYSGTVHFSKSDTSASSVLPADYTFVPGDIGVHVFTGVKLVTAGSQTVTATDKSTGTITGNAVVTVNAGPTQHFSVSAPGSAVAGHFVIVTVIAQDQFNNATAAYAGTVHFTSSDPQAGLADDSTLTSGEGFFVADLQTAGTQTITATDAANSLAGTSGGTSVIPAATNHFGVTATASESRPMLLSRHGAWPRTSSTTP